MNLTQEELRVGGLRLQRYVFSPDPGRPVRAAAIHIHGHGDYSSRYDETMGVFTDHGIACVAADLPGHGLSDGLRGCVPGWPVVDELMQRNRDRCREICPAGPLGILGHSAGGLLALRELLRERSLYSFSWISSPLLRPEITRHPVLVFLLRSAGRIFPRLRVGTGVTEDMCIHAGADPAPEEGHPPADDDLHHRRICLGWANELVAIGKWVRDELPVRPPDVPILITQGAEDPVCPAPVVREVLAGLPASTIRYEEFPDGLHEPFADIGKEEVFATIAEWLAGVLPPPAHSTSPSG